MEKPNKNLHFTNSIIILISLVWYAANFMLNIILSRNLTPAIYGDVSIVLTVLTFVVPFVLLGTDYSIPRFIPKYLNRKQFGLFKGYQIWNRRIINITYSICFTLGVIVVIIALALDHFNIYAIDRYHPVIYSFWLIPVFAYWSLESSLLDAFRRYILSSVVNLLYTLIFILLLIVGVVTLKSFGIYHVMIIIGITSIILIVILALFIKTSLPKYYYKDKPSFQEKSLWLKTSAKMMLSSVMISGLASVDILMLELLGNKENDVGYLGAIFTIFAIFAIINTSCNLIVTPNISIHTNDSQTKLDYLKQLMRSVQSLRMIASICILVIIIFAGQNILGHFGKAYTSAYYPLLILSIGNVVTISMGSCMHVLFYSGYETLINKINVLQLAIVIILDSILIPRYDLYAAVSALIAGQWICTFICLIMVKRIYGFYTIFWQFKAPDK